MRQLEQFIINHWPLWLSFFVLLLFIFLNELKDKKNQALSLSPASCVELINNNVSIFDLRDTEQYQKGHIINSVNKDAAAIEQKMDKNKSDPFVLVCLKGEQSKTLANQLRAKGFSHVSFLAGGLLNWQNEGFPLVKGK